jgi:hypothetical protein
MNSGHLLRMPAGDRGPAIRQHALHRLGELEAIEAEAARQVARRERELERLRRLAAHHHVELPAAVAARITPKRNKTHG